MENSILLLISSILTFFIAHVLFEIVQRKAVVAIVVISEISLCRLKKKGRNAKLQKICDGRSELVELVQKRFVLFYILKNRIFGR